MAITLWRISRTITRESMPFAYATTFSNTLTLFTLTGVLRNRDAVTAVSALAFAMMTLFWCIYIVCGATSIYGHYSAHIIEVMLDHLIIPGWMVALYYNNNEKSAAFFDAATVYVVLFKCVWISCVVLNSYMGLEPVYPIITTPERHLDIPRLSLLTMIALMISISYLKFESVKCITNMAIKL